MPEDGEDSVRDDGSVGSIDVPDPVENLPDPTEKLDKTAPDNDVTEFSRDADPALVNAFSRLVLALNVGLIALSLGAMLIWFRGNWGLGGWFAVAGGIVCVYAGYRYTAIRKRIDAGEFDAHAGEQ